MMAEKIYESLHKAMHMFREAGLPKDSKPKSGIVYNYRSIDSTMALASQIFDECNIAVVPVRIERKDSVIKNMSAVQIVVTYRLMSTEDGSFIEVCSIGDGFDQNDKGAGKAMSYAYKEMIFKVFCVPIKGQLDSDSEDPSLATPPPPQKTHQDYIDELMVAAGKGVEAVQSYWGDLKATNPAEADWLQANTWSKQAWSVAKLHK